MAPRWALPAVACAVVLSVVLLATQYADFTHTSVSFAVPLGRVEHGPSPQEFGGTYVAPQQQPGGAQGWGAPPGGQWAPQQGAQLMGAPPGSGAFPAQVPAGGQQLLPVAAGQQLRGAHQFPGAGGALNVGAAGTGGEPFAPPGAVPMVYKDTVPAQAPSVGLGAGAAVAGGNADALDLQRSLEAENQRLRDRLAQLGGTAGATPALAAVTPAAAPPATPAAPAAPAAAPPAPAAPVPPAPAPTPALAAPAPPAAPAAPPALDENGLPPPAVAVIPPGTGPDRAEDPDEDPEYRHTKILEPRVRAQLHEQCIGRADAPVMFLTYANFAGKDDKFCRFLESTIQNQVPIHILNWGGEHKGNGAKLVHVLKALHGADPCTTVIFTDAFDVLYAEGPEAIVPKFQQLAERAPFVMSSECGCWPFIMRSNGKQICTELYPPSPTHYRFINGGLYGGRAFAMRDVLSRVLDAKGGVEGEVAKISDQEQIGDLMLAGTIDVAIDYYTALFQNLHMADDFGLYCNPADDLQERDGELYNTHTKQTPSMFHFNGGSKNAMKLVEAGLWYRSKNANKPVRPAESVLEHPLLANYKLITFRDVCPNFKVTALTDADKAGNTHKARYSKMFEPSNV